MQDDASILSGNRGGQDGHYSGGTGCREATRVVEKAVARAAEVMRPSTTTKIIATGSRDGRRAIGKIIRRKIGSRKVRKARMDVDYD